MDVARLIAAAEVLVPTLLFVGFALQRWKSGLNASWRDEAEAQSARADRLTEEVQKLTDQVHALRAENHALQTQVTELLALRTNDGRS